MALVLGGFVFTDYSIPEFVVQGGEHKLVVHKLIGGTRVVDAMGPDDCDIVWHGRFQGPNAIGQATTLDSMRKAGAQIPLVIDTQIYTVAIAKFEWDYQRPYQILYKIACLVVTSAGDAPPTPASLTTLVVSDMTSVAAVVQVFAVSTPAVIAAAAPVAVAAIAAPNQSFSTPNNPSLTLTHIQAAKVGINTALLGLSAVVSPQAVLAAAPAAPSPLAAQPAVVTPPSPPTTVVPPLPLAFPYAQPTNQQVVNAQTFARLQGLAGVPFTANAPRVP